jgi:hypothetical protein
VERKEIFYEQGKWNPLTNFVYVIKHRDVDLLIAFACSVQRSRFRSIRWTPFFPMSLLF